MTNREKLEMVAAAGVDPNILDAEFEEVNGSSTEGLEDLL